MKFKAKDLASLVGKLYDVATLMSSDSAETYIMFSKGKRVIHSTESVFVDAKLDHGVDDCVLPFSKLIKLVNSYRPYDEIELLTSKSKFIAKRTGRGKGTANIGFIDNVEIQNRNKPKEWLDLPSDFLSAIKACSISIAPANDPNWIFTNYGIFENCVVSTDELRCTQFDFDNGGIGDRFMIPAGIAKAIESIGMDRYCLDKRSVWMRNEKFYLQFPRAMEPYPKINADVFKPNNTVKIDSEVFTSAIERCRIFAAGDSAKSHEITLSLDGKAFTLRSENDYGKSDEFGRMKTKIEASGDMKLNPNFMLEIIKHVGEPILKIGVSNNRLIFTKGTMKHVIALNV